MSTQVRSLAKKMLRGRDPRRLLGHLRSLWRQLTVAHNRRRYPIAPTWSFGDINHDSVAAAGTGRSALYIGSTPRYATASGLVWTRPNVVAVAYLLTNSIVTYRIQRSASELTAEPISTFTGVDGLGDFSGIAVTLTGDLVSVTSSEDGRLAVMRTDADGVPLANSCVTVGVPSDRVLHGVAFSPDARHIVYTSIDSDGGLRTVRVGNTPGEPLTLDLTALNGTGEPRLRAKGLRFSLDGRHLLVSYGDNAAYNPANFGHGFIAVYEWDASTGTIGRCIDRTTAADGLRCAEDVTLLADDTLALVTDQFLDAAFLIRLNGPTRRFSDCRQVLGWASGGLDMPHGCTTSPDGSTIAITNYGDGSVMFFDVAQLVGSPSGTTRRFAVDRAEK